MLLLPRYLLPVSSFLVLSYLWTQTFAASRLPQDEVDVLNQIAKTMGATNWTFGSDACEDYVDIKQVVLTDPLRNITCDCQIDNNTCHVTTIKFMRFSLPGTLPPQLVRLRYISDIDFAYNYLNGSIPLEWASMQLKFISVFANRLSGNIPSHLGNITSLTYFLNESISNRDLEANQFSGMIPPELGKLINLETLRLSSNRLSGNFPLELAELKNLTDFRINDNNFNGNIPEFISSWKGLSRLEIQGSGLKGSIPTSLSVLEKLTQMRISDIHGTNQSFPVLTNMTGLTRIVFRNCGISGGIPEYIWGMTNMRYLLSDAIGVNNLLAFVYISMTYHVILDRDLSFNELTGELTNVQLSASLKFIFLTGNSLSGNIPQSILKKGLNVDLSYNNFTLQSIEQSACSEKPSEFKSELVPKFFSGKKLVNCFSALSLFVLKLQEVEFCHVRTNSDANDVNWHSFYINCGGDTVKVNGITFEGDAGVGGGAATYHLFDGTNWGFSSTGDFTDDDDEQNTHYIATSKSSNISQLYTNARIVPTSLTYVGYCLENGNYSVNLHFTEIQFTIDNTYSSIGRRIFDIYVQDKLVEKDFDIEAKAPGVLNPLTVPYNAKVTNNILEIRFYWAGKGTTAIPVGGVYGPLISAISVEPQFKPRNGEGKKKAVTTGVAIAVVGLCLIILMLGILYRRHYFRTKRAREKGTVRGREEGLDHQTSSFTLKELKAATNNFDPVNKIGEGGFGPVYKGLLSDGTIIAVKQLSSKSRQGNREFLNEIGMIQCLQHPNLVNLYGCCIEKDQLLLVYEYMENNSLARALFGREQSQLKLDWPTRYRICLGIAKGLAYLHEESRFKIVHRDIKPTNVLLDRDLNPKISDFGLAKLDEEEKTHISTRIAGTVRKLLLRSRLGNSLVYAFHLHQNEKLMELVDQNLEFEFDKVEAERMIKVALLCANASPSLRPTTSEVVNMLEGTTPLPDTIPEAGNYSEDMKFKALRDKRNMMRNQAHYSASTSSSSGPSSTHDVPEVNAEKYLKFKAMRDSRLQLERQNSLDQISTSETPALTGSSSEPAHDLHYTI
ncbi:hypothetical protein JRO89_XS06G0032800 [Xanthoceras sorbifolium]|uniref:non-specific serine/threonine protein kinase n=1 Tax=Xanthoceras sorbifolium TaxID=99658 RepID=A0ABQ8HWR1_9ROSI|nr:hypothetical protein JRO89_XS06G0032800 [Xanthoceras sorbifolium]